ncbi:DUF1232 domain-containing protein [Candidatus Binatia bacterium]|nr:DUF1232 domain-containing protein [Candidatus Binatia bacterium]
MTSTKQQTKRKPAPTKPKTRSARRRPQPQPVRVPLLQADDIRTILMDIASTVAPGDVIELLGHADELRTRAAEMNAPHVDLFRAQLDLALACLTDHIAGDCPQIPYSTIGLLAGAVCYFSDQLDVIPDFLPNVGQLDDAVVLAMAFHMGEAGLRRYCDWKGIDLEPLRHTDPIPAYR